MGWTDTPGQRGIVVHPSVLVSGIALTMLLQLQLQLQILLLLLASAAAPLDQWHTQLHPQNHQFARKEGHPRQYCASYRHWQVDIQPSSSGGPGAVQAQGLTRLVRPGRRCEERMDARLSMRVESKACKTGRREKKATLHHVSTVWYEHTYRIYAQRTPEGCVLPPFFSSHQFSWRVSPTEPRSASSAPLTS